jgi:hypothetical protein
VKAAVENNFVQPGLHTRMHTYARVRMSEAQRVTNFALEFHNGPDHGFERGFDQRLF